MKAPITFNEWKAVEELLMRLRIGYSVIFDDHNGVAEMIVDINDLSIYRYNDGEKPAAKPTVESTEEGI